MNFNTIGGRRFILAVLSGIVATILQWYGKMDPSGTAYAAVIIATVAAYITGDTVEKLKSDKPITKPNKSVS